MSFIYLIPIILALVWSIQYDRQEDFDMRKSHRFWLLCIILSLITGLSYALGGDKQLYLTEFSDYSTDLSQIGIEIELGYLTRGEMPGWVILNVLSKILFDSFYPVQLVEAFFINFAVFYIAKRYTQHTFFFVLLYCLSFQYFNFNTEVMREAFAIGFCALGAEMLFRRCYILTGVLFLLALTFHVSAIAMVLLFPLMRFTIKPKHFLYVSLAALLFWFSSNYLFKFLIELLLGQEGMVVSKILGYSSFSTSFIALLIYMVIYQVGPYFMMHWGIEKGSQDPEIMRRKEQYITYYLCIAIIVPSFLPLARFFNYTMPILLCLTTDLLFTLLQEKRHFFTKIACVFVFWGYSIQQYIDYSPKIDARCVVLWFPYTSIVDEDDYDRSYRANIHSILVNGEKAEENTREAD